MSRDVAPERDGKGRVVVRNKHQENEIRKATGFIKSDD
jgi:hypothetical protein